MSRESILMIFVVVLLPSVVYAQDYSSLFVTARPGMVSFMVGNPQLYSATGSKAKPLALRDQLRDGDWLFTGSADCVELLLNPGSYFRIFGRGVLVVEATSLMKMHYNVYEGDFILEAVAFSKKANSLRISTPGGQLQVLQAGSYRIVVNDSNQVTVSIRSGELSLLKRGAEISILSKGKRYILPPKEKVSLQWSKLDKKKDIFDLWNQQRNQYMMEGLIGKSSQWPSTFKWLPPGKMGWDWILDH